MIFHPNLNKRLVCVKFGDDVRIDFPENLGYSEIDFSRNSETENLENLGKSSIDFSENLGESENEN